MAWTQKFTDDFNRSNEAPITTPWAAWGNTTRFNLYGNAAASPGASYRHACYVATYGADQKIQDDYTGNSDSNYTCLMVRCNADGAANDGYRVMPDTAAASVNRVDDNAYTELSTDYHRTGGQAGVRLSSGTQSFSITGTSLSFIPYVGYDSEDNTDATYSTGYCGIGESSYSTANQAFADNVVIYDASTTSETPRKRLRRMISAKQLTGMALLGVLIKNPSFSRKEMMDIIRLHKLWDK